MATDDSKPDHDKSAQRGGPGVISGLRLLVPGVEFVSMYNGGKSAVDGLFLFTMSIDHPDEGQQRAVIRAKDELDAFRIFREAVGE